MARLPESFRREIELRHMVLMPAQAESSDSAEQASVVSHKSLPIRGKGFMTQARRERRAYPKGSVRSEERSLRHKELPPSGLRQLWPVAVLLLSRPDPSGLRGCFLRRALPQAKFDATNDQLFVGHHTRV